MSEKFNVKPFLVIILLIGVIILLIGTIVFVNYPISIPARSNLDVQFLQQENMAESFSANTINVSFADLSSPQAPLFSNFDFIASNQTLNSSISAYPNDINLLELNSPYANGIQINVYENQTSGIKVEHFSCQSFISESPYFSFFPVADLSAQFATGYVSFSSSAYWLKINGSFLENSSAFVTPGSSKIGLSSQNTDDVYFLSVSASNAVAHFQFSLPNPDGGLLDVVTRATNSSPIYFFANNVEESINRGDYIVINGFSSASIEMYGNGAYNIPQSSIQSVSFSSTYPPYTNFWIKSSNITVYSSSGESKILHNVAELNASGIVTVETGLANTNPEFSGNLIISPLFLGINANQALIYHGTKSAFVIQKYRIDYPARVASTIVLSTILATPISKIISLKRIK